MRLIDADALLNKKFKYMVHGCDDLLITIKASDIENAPTIDAVEVVHGHWDEKADCSVCGMPAPTDDRIDFINISELNFCPYCGAKMNEEVTQ